ncbi:hypothetical protein Ddye_021647 [Dipteronia dyeriana]|uniref:BHLH domain-containing protein n=1 Tax=Dipteronia dyeriana TaxID=168575 RepID=A0AAD9U2L0_9ROSI|nr:hypothetical protein Ddye_021647 [Dipteronia dyeriana]
MNSKQKNKQEEEEEVEDKEINNLLLSLMEGYSDSAIPPFSDLSLPLHQEAAAGRPAIENKSSSSSRKSCSRDHGDYKEEMVQINVVKSKKEKTDQMKDNFMTLQTMLPNLMTKASRDKIIDETVSHIGVLEEEIKRLEEKKNSSSSMVANGGKISTYSNWNSSVNVTISGYVVFLGIRTRARHGMVTQIFMVFHKHGVEVLTGNVTVNHGQLTLTVTAFVDGNKDSVVVEKIKRDTGIVEMKFIMFSQAYNNKLF